MQLWLHLSLDFDPNSFSLLMHLHHLAYRGQHFPGRILISRPLSHPCAIYISAETRASRATLERQGNAAMMRAILISNHMDIITLQIKASNKGEVKTSTYKLYTTTITSAM